MALHIGGTTTEACSKCGSAYGAKYHYAVCWHGEEWLLKEDPNRPGKLLVDTGDHRGGHDVVVPSDWTYASLGWSLRGGRLPICPEHTRQGDVPCK